MSLEFLIATGIGWVTACGIYLMLRGRTFPVVLGLTLLRYAINVVLSAAEIVLWDPISDGRVYAAGRLWVGSPPILGGAPVADPLPQALVLTAIVIGFATTGLVIEMALRSRHESGTDHVDGVEPAPADARGEVPR